MKWLEAGWSGWLADLNLLPAPPLQSSEPRAQHEGLFHAIAHFAKARMEEDTYITPVGSYLYFYSLQPYGVVEETPIIHIYLRQQSGKALIRSYSRKSSLNNAYICVATPCEITSNFTCRLPSTLPNSLSDASANSSASQSKLHLTLNGSCKSLKSNSLSRSHRICLDVSQIARRIFSTSHSHSQIAFPAHPLQSCTRASSMLRRYSHRTG